MDVLSSAATPFDGGPLPPGSYLHLLRQPGESTVSQLAVRSSLFAVRNSQRKVFLSVFHLPPFFIFAKNFAFG